jgi:hypothetical protein
MCSQEEKKRTCMIIEGCIKGLRSKLKSTVGGRGYGNPICPVEDQDVTTQCLSVHSVFG